MSARPLRIGDEPARELARGRVMMIVGLLDLLLVAVAAPVSLALGAPVLGYAVGAAAWVLQRIIAQTDRRWIGRTREPRTRLGLNLFEAFGRIWLLAGAIVVAGLIGGRADGLTAALVIFIAYSIAFAVRLLDALPQERPEQ